MKIMYDTWSGTYRVQKPGKPLQLRKDPTPKMRRIMREQPYKEYRQFKVWEER